MYWMAVRTFGETAVPNVFCFDMREFYENHM